METLLAWVGLLCIPVCCVAAIWLLSFVLAGPLAVGVGAVVGFGTPLIGAHWLAGRIKRPRPS